MQKISAKLDTMLFLSYNHACQFDKYKRKGVARRMKVSKVNALDEARRILIPLKVFGKMRVTFNAPFTPCLNLTDKTITLSPQQSGEWRLDALHRLEIPQLVLDQLGWAAGDKLAVTYDTADGTATISMHEKYVPICVFCDNSEVALIINGKGICGEHVLAVMDSNHHA